MIFAFAALVRTANNLINGKQIIDLTSYIDDNPKKLANNTVQHIYEEVEEANLYTLQVPNTPNNLTTHHAVTPLHESTQLHVEAVAPNRSCPIGCS